MKKILRLFILVIIIFTFVACSGNKEISNDNQSDTSSFMASTNENKEANANENQEVAENETDEQDETTTQQEQSDSNTEDSNPEDLNTEDSNKDNEQATNNEDQEVKAKPVNDYTQGYYAYIDDKGLNIQYDNTGNIEVVVAKDNDIFEEFYNVCYDYTDSIIYYDVNPNPNKMTAGAGANNHDTYKLDLRDMSNTHFTGLNLEELIEYGPYQGYLVCSSYTNSGLTYVAVDTNGETVTNIGDYYDITNITDQIDSHLYACPVSPTGFINENIDHIYIEYSKYVAVVIEQYEGENIDSLEPVYIINPAYEEQLSFYNVSVFGTIYNVQLMSKYSMDSDYVISDIASTLTDAMICVSSAFPTDFSYDKITFDDYLGNSHEIVIEDMSGDFDVELCYAN